MGFRDAVADEISSEEVGQIALLIQKFGGIRKGIRTAIVTPEDLTFGLSRILISLLEAGEDTLPVGMRVFRRMQEANEWLQSNA